MSQRASK